VVYIIPSSASAGGVRVASSYAKQSKLWWRSWRGQGNHASDSLDEVRLESGVSLAQPQFVTRFSEGTA
jgi:hypothetical protein